MQITPATAKLTKVSIMHNMTSMDLIIMIPFIAKKITTMIYLDNILL